MTNKQQKQKNTITKTDDIWGLGYLVHQQKQQKHQTWGLSNLTFGNTQ